MLALREKRPHCTKLLGTPVATVAGKLQPLGGTGQPRGEGHVKAQKTMVTVPTLSVSSAISFSVSGMIGVCPLELLVDTGATVSL